MNVRTFDLVIEFKRGRKTYHNISRTAVNYYIDWYRENEHYVSSYYGDNLLMLLNGPVQA